MTVFTLNLTLGVNALAVRVDAASHLTGLSSDTSLVKAPRDIAGTVVLFRRNSDATSEASLTAFSIKVPRV